MLVKLKGSWNRGTFFLLNVVNSKSSNYPDVNKTLFCSVTVIKEEGKSLQSVCNWAKLTQSWETEPLNFVPASTMTNPTILC